MRVYLYVVRPPRRLACFTGPAPSGWLSAWHKSLGYTQKNCTSVESKPNVESLTDELQLGDGFRRLCIVGPSQEGS